MEYLFLTQIAVSCVTPDMGGVSFDLSPRKPFVMPGIEEQIASDVDQALHGGFLTTLTCPT